MCTRCKYPETTMYNKQKKLMAKCRACANDFQLDSSHRAGAHLMKQLPTQQSEIDAPNKGTEETKKQEPGAAASTDATKEKKSKKVEESPEEEEVQTGLKFDSEEIGKLTVCRSALLSIHDEYLVTTPDVNLM